MISQHSVCRMFERQIVYPLQFATGVFVYRLNYANEFRVNDFPLYIPVHIYAVISAVTAEKISEPTNQ
jgi:hypothetical protein